ncbi:MAG TPA: hypothetical protein VND94_01045 [Terriglobia bacterium]|nr:hypothetical protein [Terriglobia bacterium]
MTIAPDWAAQYCGIPFTELGLDRTGCNCWGLARMIYRDRAGIDLPSYVGGYHGASSADAEDIQALVTSGLRTDRWHEVDWRAADGSVKWGQIKDLDGVLLRISGHPMHMGVMIAPRLMMHTMFNEYSHPEQIDGLRWRHRIFGFYRHEKLC